MRRKCQIENNTKIVSPKLQKDEGPNHRKTGCAVSLHSNAFKSLEIWRRRKKILMNFLTGDKQNTSLKRKANKRAPETTQ